MKQKTADRLTYWQDKLSQAQTAWATEQEKMNWREGMYRGSREIRQIVKNDAVRETQHVYNIIAENIESVVDSNIPMPKVTAVRKGDEGKARVLEHMLRNEVTRLHMEELNDLQERTCPIQGGCVYLVEWDSGECSADHKGDVTITAIHPKAIIPQPGVFSGIDDMDYFGLIVPDTKEHVRRVWGVNVENEAETDPTVKGSGQSGQPFDNLVDRKIVFYRNGDRIGKFQFVGDTVLEDLEDCQARRKRRCAHCGALEGSGDLIVEQPTLDGSYPEQPDISRADPDYCPYCRQRTKWEDSTEEFMELLVPTTIQGQVYGGREDQVDEYGNVVAVATEQVPYYNPRIYPVVLQRNVSVYGQLLGESDVDRLRDQQNTMNRCSQKILNRMLAAGTAVTLPPSTKLVLDPEDTKTWRLDKPEDKLLIDTYDFTGDLSAELTVKQECYQEARNILGVTDAFQGRPDPTANSGKAKEFAAAQSAGRMASKRIMKDAAYERLYELIFKLKLAYCDEPRPVHYEDEDGNLVYEEFNRMDYLERGTEGEWGWNTNFLFSVDDTGGLSSNRSAMWREITAQFQAGTMGNPQDPSVLLTYWSTMEELHYPMAGKIRKKIGDQLRQTQAAQAQQMGNQINQELGQLAAGTPGNVG